MTKEVLNINWFYMQEVSDRRKIRALYKPPPE